MAQAIDCSGVNPVDAAIQSALDGADRFAVILRAPAELPVAATDAP
jgi:hypothetical protein